jgi:hypothetical protein
MSDSTSAPAYILGVEALAEMEQAALRLVAAIEQLLAVKLVWSALAA